MYHSLLIHSPAEGHLSCFQLYDILEKKKLWKQKKKKRYKVALMMLMVRIQVPLMHAKKENK